MPRSFYVFALSLVLVASFLVIAGFPESGKAQKLGLAKSAPAAEKSARESLRVFTVIGFHTFLSQGCLEFAYRAI